MSLTLSANQQLDRVFSRIDTELGGVWSQGQQGAMERFMEYHSNNPHVYDAFLEVISRAKKKGKTKWSIAGAIEILRWESDLDATVDYNFRFKIANDYKPIYARMVMELNPSLEGFLKTRELFR